MKMLNCIQFISFVITKPVKMPGKEMAKYIEDGSYDRRLECEGQSKAIRRNAKYSAGKVIRFSTTEDVLDIYVKYRKKALFKNMDVEAVSNLDIFVVDSGKYTYCGSLGTLGKFNMIAHGTIQLRSGSNKRREIAIFLPSYSQIYEVRINVNSEIVPTQCNRKKLVVYGSSISQGCAASSTSKSYISLVAIENDLDVINMAFSEGANGEDSIINELAASHADYYVIEYDHNASADRLEHTHRKVYEKVREKNPESKIIILTRISGGISISDDESGRREETIEKTYKYGVEHGDDRLSLIDLYKLTYEEKRKLLKDDRHPNDLGMRYIADRINRLLRDV